MSVVQWHLAVQYIACALTTPGCRSWQEWNIAPFCWKGSAEFMDIAGLATRCRTWQSWRIGRPREDWDVFSFQKLYAYSGNLIRPSIILLDCRDVTEVNEWHIPAFSIQHAPSWLVASVAFRRLTNLDILGWHVIIPSTLYMECPYDGHALGFHITAINIGQITWASKLSNFFGFVPRYVWTLGASVLCRMISSTLSSVPSMGEDVDIVNPLKINDEVEAHPQLPCSHPKQL